MFETFYQNPVGSFKRSFYNPFEVKHRRRTTKSQLRILEEAYREDNRPTSSARRALATRLGMTPRAVQVWFQNRRAKIKGGVLPDGAQPDEGEGSSFPSTVTDSPNSGIGLVQFERNRQFTGSVTGPIKKSVSGSAYSNCFNGMAIRSDQMNALGRRHSMPEMQVAGLPFKELHQAIFGKDAPSLMEMPTPPTVSAAQAIANGPIPKGIHMLRGPTDGRYPAYIPVPTIPATVIPRKNSGCSHSFLSDFMTMGLNNFANVPTEHHFANHQYAPPLADPMVENLEAFSQGMHNCMPRQFTLPHSVGQNLSQMHHIPRDYLAPSISVPQSSPAIGGAGHEVSYYSASPESHEMRQAEDLAHRISMSFTPNELDVFLNNIDSVHSKNDLEHYYDHGQVYYNHQVSEVSNHIVGVNPMELSGCLPNRHEGHFLFQD